MPLFLLDRTRFLFPLVVIAALGWVDSAASAPTVVASDSFNFRASNSPCELGPMDAFQGGSTSLRYVPMWGGVTPVGVHIGGNVMFNPGLDFGGAKITDFIVGCAGEFSSAFNFGQDLNIQLQIRVPSDEALRLTRGGPIFRTSSLGPGADLFAGGDGGYWVQLTSRGEVLVRALATAETVATSGVPASFDSNAFHALEAAPQGGVLQVALNGFLQTFELAVDQSHTTSVPIPATTGQSSGGVGVSFSSEDNPGLIGGQQIESIVILTSQSLSGLPVQNNFEAAAATPTPTLSETPVPTPTFTQETPPTNSPTATPTQPGPSPTFTHTQAGATPTRTPTTRGVPTGKVVPGRLIELVEESRGFIGCDQNEDERTNRKDYFITSTEGIEDCPPNYVSELNTDPNDTAGILAGQPPTKLSVHGSKDVQGQLTSVDRFTIEDPVVGPVVVEFDPLDRMSVYADGEGLMTVNYQGDDAFDFSMTFPDGNIQGNGALSLLLDEVDILFPPIGKKGNDGAEKIPPPSNCPREVSDFAHEQGLVEDSDTACKFFVYLLFDLQMDLDPSIDCSCLRGALSTPSTSNSINSRRARLKNLLRVGCLIYSRLSAMRQRGDVTPAARAQLETASKNFVIMMTFLTFEVVQSLRDRALECPCTPPGDNTYTIDVTSPVGDETDKRVIDFTGTVSPATPGLVGLLTVNGNAQAVGIDAGGNFNVKVILRSGDNRLFFTATDNLVGKRACREILIKSTVPRTSISVTLTWNLGSSDVDLYVTQPDGQTAWYQDLNTDIGGRLDVDNTSGFGPENYYLSSLEGDTVLKGQYTVRVHYYSDGLDGPETPTRPVNWQVTVLLNEGTPEEATRTVDGTISQASNTNDSPTSNGPDWEEALTFNPCPSAEGNQCD